MMIELAGLAWRVIAGDDLLIGPEKKRKKKPYWRLPQEKHCEDGSWISVVATFF